MLISFKSSATETQIREYFDLYYYDFYLTGELVA